VWRSAGVGHASIVAQEQVCTRGEVASTDMPHRTRHQMKENLPMRQKPKRLHRIIQQGLIYSLLLAVAILGLGGVGFWLIDPNILTLSDGLWLAFTTAATVGFGDVVPSTHASRAFSVLVVLLGLAVLSLVTASLSAVFFEKEVEDEERQIEKDLMHEIRHLRHEVADLRRDIQALSSTGQTGDH
jgi:voltage-gated potassium channel